MAALRIQLSDGGRRGRGKPGKLTPVALMLSLRFLGTREVWQACPRLCTNWYQLLVSRNIHLEIDLRPRSVRAFSSPQILPTNTAGRKGGEQEAADWLDVASARSRVAIPGQTVARAQVRRNEGCE